MPKNAMLLEADSIPQAWGIMVPEYKSVQYAPLVLKIAKWESKYADAIRKVSTKRADNRWKNYIIPEELERVRARLATGSGSSSIRFGRRKDGHGYHGERGDFCLVGGAIDGRNLSVFYRSLELIGGFAYDLTLIDELGNELGIKWKTVQMFSPRAHVFALKGNSNEKLFPKLKEIFRE